MSDTYGADEPQAEFDPANFLLNEQRSAKASALGSLQDDPEKAARAAELSDATGDHPALVYGNLENYEQQHKAALTAQLLNSNKYLTEYVNSHPLADKISNDDYGNLDAVSAHVQKLNLMNPEGPGGRGIYNATGSILSTAFQGFKDNYSGEEFDTERQKLAQILSESPVFGNIFIRQAAQASAEALAGSMRLFSGVVGGTAAGVGEAYKQLGGSESSADRLTRDLIILAQVGLSGQAGLHGQVHPSVHTEIAKFTGAVKPYLDAGVEPPVGLHPLIDQVKVEQSKVDLASLDDAFKEAQASRTKERNPEIFASFIRQHTDASIGIDAEAVRAMYGDKAPTPGDGKLGDFPGVAEQLAAAEASGGDVQVPLADWLAKADPKVASELHDSIRVRPGGVTVEEAKELPTKPKEDQWFAGSKVVNEYNEPIRAYHGTTKDFDTFNTNPETANRNPNNLGQLGSWFSAEPKNKANYDQGNEQFVAESFTHGKGFDEYKEGARVIPSYLSIKKPKEFQDYEELQDHVHEAGGAKAYRAQLEAEGHDGIVIRDSDTDGAVSRDDWVAFHSEQIKSAFTTPLDTLRQSSALNPLFQADARKVELRPLEDNQPGAETRGFSLHDAQGEELGGLTISEEKGGKRLYVDDIESGLGPQSLGPSTMRDVLRQIQEAYPNAETISGMRVSGAREKAGAQPKVEIPLRELAKTPDEDLATRFKELGWEEEYGFGNKAIVLPKDLYTENEKAIVDAVNSELARVIPKQAEVAEAHALRGPKGDTKYGMHFVFDNRQPLILWSLESPDAVGTGRHEALHHLRQQGFFTKDEWATLSYEAAVGDWIGKHNIRERYDDLSARDQIEEAVAEEFAHWRRDEKGFVRKAIDKVVGKGKVDPIFRKLRDLLDGIKEKIKGVLGFEPTAEDLFNKADRGEVGSREGNAPLLENAFKEQREPELPQAGTTRLEDREVFAKASAIGMTVDQYKRYMALIDRRAKEDLEAATAHAEAEQRKRQTKEWKANAADMRKDVETDITSRPDVAADTLLRSGRLYGEELSSKPKLDPDGLDDAQRGNLPKEYLARDGMHPDDLAGLFGYSSGKALVDRLIQLNKEREASGMKPDDFVRRMVDAETDRRMVAKYGDLERNILDEAKDQALSETQLDLLHEETLALAAKAGAELSITKEGLKAWVKDEFDKTKIGDISTDKFLAAAGKAGRAAEEALLADKPADAFRAKQQQYIAITMANAAKKIEKAQAQFAKLAKRFSAREVPSVQPEYTNFIHDIFLRIGEPVRRSVQDLQESIARDGYKSLDDFVQTKEADLRDLHVPDYLRDARFRKELKDFTAQEFEQLHNAVKALAHNGRDELKVIRAGETADFKDVLKEMTDKIATLGPAKTYAIDRKPNVVKETAKSWWWSGITVESMLNRLDRDDPHGVFYQTITRQFTDASNHKDRMIRDYQAKVSELGKIPDIDTKVENDLFVDPNTGQPFQMRRRNVLGVLQNVGNANNLKKLAEGYKLKPEQVMDWLRTNTTKEDWDRAQKIGDIFADLFEKANVMSHQISGVGVQKLPLAEIDTPFGKYPGWYNPIKYDSLRPGESKKLLGPSLPEAEGFYRATTPQGYTNQRTGYIAPMELDLNILPIRMKQMIHDITMRPAVLQMSKFFYNKEFKSAMIKHFGQHQAEEMIPFLRNVANASNFKSMSEYYGGQGLEYFRQNTIATLIGLNPSTVMKHGPTALINSLSEVGVANFAREFASLTSMDEISGKSNWTMAMEKSEELSRRMRNYTEVISGHGSEIYVKGVQTKFGSYREFMMHVGATPVSISDLLSAVPTFLAEYKKQIADGVDEGNAVSLANRAVRRAHGSSVLSNKPSIARTNALGAMFSSLYGFFSHMQQKQYELGWKAKDLIADTIGKGSGDPEGGQRHAPDLLKGFMSYIIFPALIEELVTPYSNSDKDSWGMKAAKTLGLGISSSFIGVRDFVRALINVRDPEAGLIGTTLKMGTDIARDIRKGPSQMVNKQNAGNVLKHTTALVGVLTGLTNAQEGRMAEYMYRYSQGMEHPKGPWGAAVGLRYGTGAKHSQTFDEWQRH